MRVWRGGGTPTVEGAEHRLLCLFAIHGAELNGPLRCSRGWCGWRGRCGRCGVIVAVMAAVVVVAVVAVVIAIVAAADAAAVGVVFFVGRFSGVRPLLRRLRRDLRKVSKVVLI